MAISSEQQETSLQADTPRNDNGERSSEADKRDYRGSQSQNVETINELRQQILELKTRINQLETTPEINNKYEWLEGYYDPENAKRISEKWGNK